MPLYEYRCKKCAHQFERIQKFSDKPVTRCPECGGRVEQLISPPAVQFKGEGWYVTDYARKSSPRSSEGGESSATKTESKSEAKSESKSETKTEDKPKKSHSHK
jgi:putative FmdB family regulatory protein